MTVSGVLAGRGTIPSVIASQEDLLGTISSINGEFLQLITSPEFAPSYRGRQFLCALAPVLNELSPKAIAYALNFPFLFIDLRFNESRWWRGIPPLAETVVRDGSELSQEAMSRIRPLVRSALTLALHLARAERDTALVLLGLTPAVTDLLAHRGFHELEALTDLGCHLVRPRWADRAAVWQHLLAAGDSLPVRSGRDFVLHALQLSTAEHPDQRKNREHRNLLR